MGRASGGVKGVIIRGKQAAEMVHSQIKRSRDRKRENSINMIGRDGYEKKIEIGNMPNVKKVAEHYDKISKYYGNFLRRLFEFRLYVETLRYINSGDAALDVACGTGNMSFELAKRFQRVYGIDISKGMLNNAKQKIKMAKNRQIGFIYSDGEYLPFKDKSFDAVTCVFAIDHFPNPEKAISEMMRVLKEKGILVVTFLERAPPSSLKDKMWWRIFKRIWKRIDPKWKELSTDIDSEKLCRILGNGKKYERRDLLNPFFRCHFNNVVFVYQKDCKCIK